MVEIALRFGTQLAAAVEEINKLRPDLTNPLTYGHAYNIAKAYKESQAKAKNTPSINASPEQLGYGQGRYMGD